MFGCGRGDWPANPQKEFENYRSKVTLEEKKVPQKLEEVNIHNENEVNKEIPKSLGETEQKQEHV